MLRKICLVTYYLVLIRLQHSTVPIFGMLFERMKELFVKQIFAKSGKNINISKGARFGNGQFLFIGNNSSIGLNCKVPNNIKIGENVMMGPNVMIFGSNHASERTDIPMIQQGYKKYPPVTIEDDVWVGANSIILPGVVIKKGSIVAAGAVVTKSFPEFSIIGGNPAKIIKSRLDV